MWLSFCLPGLPQNPSIYGHTLSPAYPGERPICGYRCCWSLTSTNRRGRARKNSRSPEIARNGQPAARSGDVAARYCPGRHRSRAPPDAPRFPKQPGARAPAADSCTPARRTIPSPARSSPRRQSVGSLQRYSAPGLLYPVVGSGLAAGQATTSATGQ